MSVVSRNPFDLLGDDGEQSSSPAPAKTTPAPAAAKKETATRNVPGSGANNSTSASASAGAGAGGRGGASRGGRYPSRGGPRNVTRGEGGDKGPRNTGPDPASGSLEGQETPGGFEKERVPAAKRAHNGPDKHTKGPRGEGRQETSGGHKSRGGGNSRGAKTPAFGGERRQFERKSGTLPDSQKKVDQGWGANEGEAELTAEVEGEKDAEAEEAAPGTPAEADAAPTGTGFEDATENKEETAEEPEEVQKTYEQFLAEKAEQAFAFGKKAAREVADATVEGTAFVREGIDDFFSGKEKTTAPKTKAKKEKVFIEFDGQFAQPAGSRPPRENRGERGEGGRGGRGGRGRGEGRGGAAGRGRGGPRGGFANRSGGGNNGPSVNIDASNEKAFPALGA